MLNFVLYLLAAIGLGLAAFGVGIGRIHPGWAGLCLAVIAYRFV